MKVYELLSDPSKWTQNTSCLDKENNPCLNRSDEAAKWCLMGAMHYCYDLNEYNKLYNEVRDFLNESLAYFNDTHTYEEVIAVAKGLDF